MEAAIATLEAPRIWSERPVFGPRGLGQPGACYDDRSDSQERSLPWSADPVSPDERRARALEAANLCLSGQLPAVIDALDSWRISVDTTWATLALAQVVQSPPRPTPEQLAWLGPGEGDDVRLRLAWALDALHELGLLIEARHRRPWLNAGFAPNPAKDARTTALWASWMSGSPWDVREPWEKMFLGEAARAFRAVLSVRGVPRDRRRGVLRDLEEAFFYQLLGASKGAEGWRELAIRVIETGPRGPIDSMASAIRGHTWGRVTNCAVSRGHGPVSAEVLFPDLPHSSARAMALLRRAEADPSVLERALDLHVLLRVLDTWSREDTDHDRAERVVVQNRGRARARLRAALIAGPLDALQDAVFGTEALYARTLAATGWFARDWAWQQCAHDFAFHTGAPITPPCEDAREGHEPLTVGERRTLRAWVCLVILKERLGHLKRWARTGSAGDRDTGWGRLLSDGLPESLRDEGSDGRRASTYFRIRAVLALDLDDVLADLFPTLEQLSALDPDARDLKSRFQLVLEPIWDASIPQPRARLSGCLRAARVACERLADEMEMT